MIYEFALEPALVARWHDPKEYFFFRYQFGVQSRRVVSQFPKKKWRRLVWQEFKSGPSGQNQNSERRMDALISEFCEAGVGRSISFSEREEWLEQAEAEHERRPFRAILALENSREHEGVIDLERLFSDDPPERWRIPELSAVRRRAQDLAEAVGPFLCICRKIVLVDPHFDPSARRLQDPLRAFLSQVTRSIHETDNLEIELHTSIERFFHRSDDREGSEEERIFSNLQRNCELQLPEQIPAGMTVTFRVWKHLDSGERLHNRYILGDIAGIMFGTGLDDEDTGESDRYGGQTEDITLLSDQQFARRRTQYCNGSTAFAPVGEPFQIEGRNEDCLSGT